MKGSRFIYGTFNVVSASDIVTAQWNEGEEFLTLWLRGEPGPRDYYDKDAQRLWAQIRDLDTTPDYPY